MNNIVINIYCIKYAVILANTSSTSGADKQNFPSIWILITTFAAGVATLAAFTGNLQTIIDFIKSNFLRKPVEISEEKRLRLRKQLLARLQNDNSIRVENSLHNLIKIDLKMKEQCYQVGGKTEELIPQDRKAEKSLFNRLFEYFNRDDRSTIQLKSLNRFSIWDANIRNESELLELCRKPLFLTMLVVAYQGRVIRNSSELFESYIDQKLDDPDSQGTYPPRKSPTKKQTLHYLTWLAKKLEDEEKTEFLIEEIQPTLLVSTKQKIIYRITVFLIVLFFGLVQGLVLSLLTGSVIWLNLGLVFWLFFGWKFGQFDIELVEKLSFSLENVKDKLVQGLVVGSFLGLFFGLYSGLVYGIFQGLVLGLLKGVFYGLYYGASVGLTFGLYYGLFRGLVSSELEDKNFPNQGIHNSLKNGLVYGLVFGLVYGLVGGLILGLLQGLVLGLVEWLRQGLDGGLIFMFIFGLVLGPFLGLYRGIGSAIQHFTLRLILYQNGDIPWNYAKFLDHAAKYRFIQRVGGRYRFMHDLLRKHFAQMQI